MRINVSNLTNRFEKITDVAVLVDVLRSSTAVATALKNGCKFIVPFESIKNAKEARKKNEGEDIILVGENCGLTPEGFDFNSSPKEMNRKNVKGKIIYFKSTNLTRILTRLTRLHGGIDEILIGGLINAKFVAMCCRELQPENVNMIVCGNRHNPFNIEDFVGAGAIVHFLGEKNLTDMAMASLVAYRNPESREKMWEGSTARYLIKVGLKDDIPLCLRENYIDVVPIFKDGRITRLESHRA